MIFRPHRIIPILLVSAAVVVGAIVVTRPQTWQVSVTPTLEDRLPDNSLYNPSTQSFLRENHWLDSVTDVEFAVHADNTADLHLEDPQGEHHIKVKGIPLDQLVPRLHYVPASPPDAFDAYNLMLAEYSRNSLSVPVGKPSDSMSHFETDLDEVVPWTLVDDYEFSPNPNTRPVRFSVVNNCLAPGLWEFSATDRTGEIYHAWYHLPSDRYAKLVAETNNLPIDFCQHAITWKEELVDLKLDRLRKIIGTVDQANASIIDGLPMGYSSQDARRKLHKHFVQVDREGVWDSPTSMKELTTLPCRFSDFAPPGKYLLETQKNFNFRFLRGIKSATVSLVEPRTHYNWRNVSWKDLSYRPSPESLEIVLHLPEHDIIIGNLDTSLLVPQEDYVINGFGAGILSSSGLAERRNFLIQDGPSPPYAYLCTKTPDGLKAVNSHTKGIEQIFIRTHSREENPWWEITITSFERITDIVKYRVEVPESLRDSAQRAADEYVSPLYRTYRDDNLR